MACGFVLVGPKNNNNNNNIADNVYGAVIMTVIARVHPVHLMNLQTERRVAANPQTKPTDLVCESAKSKGMPRVSK